MNVWIIKTNVSYSGGMAVIAADTADEAVELLRDYFGRTPWVDGFDFDCCIEAEPMPLLYAPVAAPQVIIVDSYAG